MFSGSRLGSSLSPSELELETEDIPATALLKSKDKQYMGIWAFEVFWTKLHYFCTMIYTGKSLIMRKEKAHVQEQGAIKPNEMKAFNILKIAIIEGVV